MTTPLVKFYMKVNGEWVEADTASINLCEAEDRCNFGGADCTSPLAVSIDQRISDHIAELFNQFNPCNPTASYTDVCERPHLGNTISAMQGFFANLTAQIICPTTTGSGQGASSCVFSAAIEEKIHTFANNLLKQAKCYSGGSGGGGAPNPVCSSDNAALVALATTLKDFIRTEVLGKNLEALNGMVKGVVDAVCSGTIGTIALTSPCATSEDNELVKDLAETLFDHLGEYTDKLKGALSGGGGCASIKGFLEDALGAGISVTAGECNVSLHSDRIEFSCGNCKAYAGTQKLYLECAGNSILADHTGVFVNRANGDEAGLDLIGQKIYMLSASGEYVEASPTRLFLTDGGTNEVEIKQDSANIKSNVDYVISGEKTGTSAEFSLNTSGEMYAASEDGNYIAFGSTLPSFAISSSDVGLHAQVEDSKLQFTSNDGSGLMKSTVMDGDTWSKIRSTPDITSVNVSDGEDEASVSVWGAGLDINFGDGTPDIQINTDGLYATIPSSNTQVSLDENGLTLAFDATGSVNFVEKFGDTVADWTQTIVSEVKVEAGKAGVRATSTAGQIVVWGNATETWSIDNPTNIEIATDLGLGIYATSGNKTEIDTEEIKITDSESGEVVSITVPEKGGDGDKLSASWKEVDVCVDGVAKKAMVLMTEPYDAS
jgi:hypothetical protein